MPEDGGRWTEDGGRWTEGGAQPDGVRQWFAAEGLFFEFAAPVGLQSRFPGIGAPATSNRGATVASSG